MQPVSFLNDPPHPDNEPAAYYWYDQYQRMRERNAEMRVWLDDAIARSIAKSDQLRELERSIAEMRSRIFAKPAEAPEPEFPSRPWACPICGVTDAVGAAYSRLRGEAVCRSCSEAPFPAVTLDEVTDTDPTPPFGTERPAYFWRVELELEVDAAADLGDVYDFVMHVDYDDAVVSSRVTKVVAK